MEHLRIHCANSTVKFCDWSVFYNALPTEYKHALIYIHLQTLNDVSIYNSVFKFLDVINLHSC